MATETSVQQQQPDFIRCDCDGCEGCGNCPCRACHRRWYCSDKCAARDWTNHHDECNVFVAQRVAPGNPQWIMTAVELDLASREEPEREWAPIESMTVFEDATTGNLVRGERIFNDELVTKVNAQWAAAGTTTTADDSNNPELVKSATLTGKTVVPGAGTNKVEGGVRRKDGTLFVTVLIGSEDGSSPNYVNFDIGVPLKSHTRGGGQGLTVYLDQKDLQNVPRAKNLRVESAQARFVVAIEVPGEHYMVSGIVNIPEPGATTRLGKAGRAIRRRAARAVRRAAGQNDTYRARGIDSDTGIQVSLTFEHPRALREDGAKGKPDYVLVGVEMHVPPGRPNSPLAYSQARAQYTTYSMIAGTDLSEAAVDTQFDAEDLEHVVALIDRVAALSDDRSEAFISAQLGGAGTPQEEIEEAQMHLTRVSVILDRLKGLADILAAEERGERKPTDLTDDTYQVISDALQLVGIGAGDSYRNWRELQAYRRKMKNIGNNDLKADFQTFVRDAQEARNQGAVGSQSMRKAEIAYREIARRGIRSGLEAEVRVLNYLKGTEKTAKKEKRAGQKQQVSIMKDEGVERRRGDGGKAPANLPPTPST